MSKADYIDFQNRIKPLAYLITIRCYGTWLHGDRRGSMYRREHNVYGTPTINPSKRLVETEEAELVHPPIRLSNAQRGIVEKAIREVCKHRGYKLLAVNARTNHVHSVVAASCKPERIMASFKSYATRHLRQAGLLATGLKPWSRHGSTPYLWTPEEVERAIGYVTDGQSDEPFARHSATKQNKGSSSLSGGITARE